MDISELSNVYNDTNTKKVSAVLKTIKQLYGNRLFETLLSDILAGNKPGIDQTIRKHKKELPDPRHSGWDVYRDIDGRNAALHRLHTVLDFADRYNSKEEKCENCGKIGADVWKRSNGKLLCSKCADDIVDEVKLDPLILRAVTDTLSSDSFELPDDYTPIDLEL